MIEPTHVLTTDGVFALNEDVLCIYADLDSLIGRAGLSDQEKLTVDLLMRGYAVTDIAEHYGKSRQNFEILLKRAVKKIVKRNNADWEEIEDPTIVGPIEDMWVLEWVRTSPTSGINTLQLLGKVGAMTLQFNGIVNDKLTMGALYLAEDDIATYERGHGQPSFEN